VRDPIEWVVHGALRSTGRRSEAVCAELRDDPTIQAIGDDLASCGLLVKDAHLLPYRLALLPPAVVWIIGLVRLVNGAALDRPIAHRPRAGGISGWPGWSTGPPRYWIRTSTTAPHRRRDCCRSRCSASPSSRIPTCARR
jgi:hypothetical protein